MMWWPSERGGVRVDGGFETGDVVPSLYDSLLGKVIAHAESREHALDRLIEAMQDVRVHGVASNASWLTRALREPDFRRGEVSTAFVAKHGDALAAPADARPAAAFAAAAYTWAITPKHAVTSPWELADGFRAGQPSFIRVPLRADERNVDATVVSFSLQAAEVRLDGETFHLKWKDELAPVQQWQDRGGSDADVLVSPHTISVWLQGELSTFEINDGSQFDTASAAHAGSLTTPLPGVVVSVAVREGDTVTAGQTLLVIEAMKMEHAIKAPRAGTVRALKHQVGDRVREGSTLAEIE
jgi:acetyl/propionyl-CoA carboxylase alpha subunit